MRPAARRRRRARCPAARGAGAPCGPGSRAPARRPARRGRARRTPPRARRGARPTRPPVPPSAQRRAGRLPRGRPPPGRRRGSRRPRRSPRGTSPSRAEPPARARSVCPGVTDPASGRSRSRRTSRPARTTTRTSCAAPRVSNAPTVSASRAPAGPPTLPKAGPPGPSFPAAVTTSVSSANGAAHRPRQRAVRERGERLDERDERDPGRVVRVAVAVRVDGALEAREELVGAGVDRVAAAVVGLPPGDADREHGRAGSDAAEPRGPPGADEQAGHLRAVALELGRVGRLRVRARVRPVPDHVEAVEHVAVQVRLVQVDARVEQRDRHAASAQAGEPDGGTPAQHRPCSAREQLRRHGGRERDPHRVDALHAGRPLEQCDRAGVEERGEAVQRPREPELGRDPDAAAREVGEELLLRGDGGGRPAALVAVARPPAGPCDPVGERERAQDDQHPLARGHRGARTADQPAPRLGGTTQRRPRRRGAPAARPDRRAQRRRRSRRARRRQRPRYATA